MRKMCILLVLVVLYILPGIGILETPAKAVTEQPKKAVGRIVPQNHDEEYLFFDMNFLYRSGRIGEFKPLNEGSVLHSGDLYKIIFTPATDCYVYIFQLDSANKIYQLFPMESFAEMTINNLNPVKRGNTYYIPAKGKSFQLDQQTGIEKMYFLASRQRDIVLEEQYQKVFEEQQRSKNDLKEPFEDIEQLLNHAIKIQGALITPEKAAKLSWREEGQAFSVFQERLENLCDGCVYVLRFEHK